MDIKTIRETVIKPKLAESFGATMANLLVTKAITSCMKGKNESEKIKLLVTAVCSDPKVIGMWGAAETGKYKNEWLRMA
jgi:hypothetical protein